MEPNNPTNAASSTAHHLARIRAMAAAQRAAGKTGRYARLVELPREPKREASWFDREDWVAPDHHDTKCLKAGRCRCPSLVGSSRGWGF